MCCFRSGPKISIWDLVKNARLDLVGRLWWLWLSVEKKDGEGTWGWMSADMRNFRSDQLPTQWTSSALANPLCQRQLPSDGIGLLSRRCGMAVNSTLVGLGSADRGTHQTTKGTKPMTQQGKIRAMGRPLEEKKSIEV